MVGIIKNLFGGKGNYYAELDEEQAPATSESEQTQSQAKPATAPQSVTEQPKEEAPAPQAQPVPAPSVTPAPVQNNNNTPNPLAGETFAPTYLIPKSTMPRRRPGVNMGQYLDMARQMQTPRNQ
ncbi:MAG: hypothetical protein GVY17_14685 [Cyanobacteria bacterium]|jgi:hypothetical protein|nr:hypothetical protein [Cyanobacteria bacterium GSL.Bin21]